MTTLKRMYLYYQRVSWPLLITRDLIFGAKQFFYAYLERLKFIFTRQFLHKIIKATKNKALYVTAVKGFIILKDTTFN